MGSLSEQDRDELTRLYEVADDFEADVLDGLRHKAGLIWTCDGPHADGQPGRWTQPTGTPCEWCGRTDKGTDEEG